MRGAILLAGLGLAAALAPPAWAGEPSQTLYFHPDGSLTPEPGVGLSGDATYASGPAAEPFILRTQGLLYVRATGILDGSFAATIYRNGQPFGSGSISGSPLTLGKSVGVVLDNQETTFTKGDILSVRIDAGRGLLGGVAPVSLLLDEASLPAPQAAPAPAPVASPSPAPATPTPVQANPPMSNPSGSGAPSAGSTASTGGNTGAGSTIIIPPVAPPAWLSSLHMPWENATGALVLVLIAVTMLGAWSLVRLGRI